MEVGTSFSETERNNLRSFFFCQFKPIEMSSLRKITLARKQIHPQHARFGHIPCKKWFYVISLYLAPDSLVLTNLSYINSMYM